MRTFFLAALAAGCALQNPQPSSDPRQTEPRQAEPHSVQRTAEPSSSPRQEADRATGATPVSQERERGERAYAEGAYEEARKAYLAELERARGTADERWARFRLADATWRSLASTERADPSELEAARRDLEALVRDIRREDEMDRVWAEVHESLGDFHWTTRTSNDWNAAWPSYEKALDWWAGSSDLALARERYLDIVWTTATPGGLRGWEYGNWVPTPDAVIENAIQVAEDLDDRARAHVLRAITLQNRGGWSALARVAREFEAALEGGREQPWYDDALFSYAQWLESRGRVVRDEQGRFRQAPDHERALELYRRIVADFSKSESRFHDDARQAIERITKPQLSVNADRVFAPGAKVFLHASLRNVREVALELHAFDPLRLRPEEKEHLGGWLQQVDPGREPLTRWKQPTGDTGRHEPIYQRIEVERTLSPGAYLLVATAEGAKPVKELVLVTDAHLVIETDAERALVWMTGAELGAPIAGARVQFWEQDHESGGRRHLRSHEGTTDASGLATFELSRHPGYRDLLAFATLGERVAYARAGASRQPEGRVDWRVQAITDRPTYRPEDTVRWKLVARRRVDGVYTTPAGERLEYTVTGPMGNDTSKGTVVLGPFGSASGELALDASMPLGEYTIRLRRDVRNGEWIGAAALFRLEEYKLPEFEVTVTPKSEDGKPRTFRAGDEVEATISAQAYAGGAIANANVEVVVFQRPMWVVRPVPREFPWLHGDEENEHRRWGWNETEIRRETLATDAEGLATIRFPTPLEAQQDLEFRIEARVTDASRREVTGEGRVRVGRQSYAVSVEPRKRVHGPGDTVEVDVNAYDANRRPVAAEGALSVVRLTWFRIWRDATGREIDDAEHEDLVRRGTDARFVVARADYRREVVLTRPVATNAEGKATFTFEAGPPACYAIEWSSADVDGSPILASGSIWVAGTDTEDLAWRRGEIEIVIDRDTLRAGEDAVVLLTSASGPAAVLLTVGSTELFSWQVVELTGSAKLVRIPLDERHVPNSYIRAQVVRRGQVWLDQEEIVVPPYEHFLQVSVEPEKPEIRPGDTTSFRVVSRGYDGEPVAAEVALAVIDEAVIAIQEDYAVDPREFFFGDRKGLNVQSGATSNERTYGIALRDEEELAEAEERDGSDLGEWGASRARAEGKRGIRAPESAPAPGAPVAKARGDDLRASKIAALESLGYAGGTGGAVTVRSDFRASAFWKADVVTSEDGTARVEVPMPQSLTRWRASAHAMTKDSAFGQGAGSTRTNLPLTVRLQAPRFFVVGDVCTISALVDNRGEKELEAEVALFRGSGDDVTPLEPRKVRVAAGATERVDWTLDLERVGMLRLRTRAVSGDLADAMERTYDVHERGIDQLVAKSGKLAGGSGTIRLDVPADRKPGTTSLVVAVTPSTAATMLDALPYLIDYPYGCTEQTMSRFLPAAIVAKTLTDLHLDAEAAMARVFGGVEGEYASKTHPKGKKSLALVAEVTRDALERLYSAQRSDGSWGWWPSAQEGDEFMTAYVAWGLAVARDAGIEVDVDRLQAAARWLDARLVEAEVDPDLAAWMLHAHAAEGSQVRSAPALAALDKLWASRDSLNAYGRALFALAALANDQGDRARSLADALANGVIVDRTPDTSIVERSARASDPAAMATAHWGTDGIHWRWSEGAVESTSTALRALLAIRPDHELVQPAMNWLFRNRRGAQWASTRDSAIAVLALTEYLKRSGEAEAAVAFEVRVNGRPVGTKSYARGEALAAPARFQVGEELVRDGANEIEVVRTSGDAPLYFAIEARYFSREKPIRAAGNEVFVRREYFALVPRKTLLKGYVHDRIALAQGAEVESGTRIETVVTVEAKNDLEYMILEDLKPAGLEAVTLTSGEPAWARELRADAQGLRIAGVATGDDEIFTGRTSWVHQELRDRKVASFVALLPQGVWELRYEMRAEVPGRFQALPVIAQAMYVPEIRGNDTEQEFVVR